MNICFREHFLKTIFSLNELFFLFNLHRQYRSFIIIISPLHKNMLLVKCEFMCLHFQLIANPGLYPSFMTLFCRFIFTLRDSLGSSTLA